MGKAAKTVYMLLGLMGAAFLVTAYYAENQLIHQMGATAGILGMVLVGAVCRVRQSGWKEYLLLWARRDIAIAVAWAILLCIRIVNPVV